MRIETSLTEPRKVTLSKAEQKLLMQAGTLVTQLELCHVSDYAKAASESLAVLLSDLGLGPKQPTK